ncbi:MAG: hypothetical protein AAF358_13525 [Pseudomonadota bacterium]
MLETQLKKLNENFTRGCDLFERLVVALESGATPNVGAGAEAVASPGSSNSEAPSEAPAADSTPDAAEPEVDLGLGEQPEPEAEKVPSLDDLKKVIYKCSEMGLTTEVKNAVITFGRDAEGNPAKNINEISDDTRMAVYREVVGIRNTGVAQGKAA